MSRVTSSVFFSQIDSDFALRFAPCSLAIASVLGVLQIDRVSCFTCFGKS